MYRAIYCNKTDGCIIQKTRLAHSKTELGNAESLRATAWDIDNKQLL